MMLADPGRMHAELVGVNRFGGDVGNELVSVARIVLVVIVAEGEVSEFHVRLLPFDSRFDGGASPAIMPYRLL